MKRPWIVLAGLALFTSGPILAGTIYVDDDAPGDPGPGDPTVSDPLEDGTAAHPYDAIQEGIDAAIGGDTVQVTDGTYTGDGNRDLDFGGKAITLASENGRDATIIDCERLGWGFIFQSGETGASVIDGFTVRNGSFASGGGVHCYESSPRIANCVICDCRTSSSDGSGGGVSLNWSNATFVNCVIRDNTARNDGGGIRLYYSNAIFTNCIITGNTAQDDGGGIFSHKESGTFINCMISRNSTHGKGGAAYLRSGSPTLIHCTIYDNVSDEGSGGVHIYGSIAFVRVSNCILWGNGEEVTVEYGTLQASYCNVEGGYPGVGNIDADPSVLNPAGGDYHLTAHSPCIDAGSAEAPETDFEGEWRWDDPDIPNTGGTQYDIGADEWVDTDGDDLPNYWETEKGLDPDDDTGDQGADGDPDGDMLTNMDEYLLGTHPLSCDTDNDGMDDGWEAGYGFDPLVDDSAGDPDGDDLANVQEFENGTNPFNADTDNDAMPDGWEVENTLNPLIDDSADDPDGDGLGNLVECNLGTDPHDPDCDDDGLMDGLEVAAGTNPFHPDNLEKTYYINVATGDDASDGLAAAWDGVHGPTRTIRAGIARSVAGYGYTVLVADGVYDGPDNRDLDYEGRDITLVSENGPAYTIIDCEGAGRAFKFWYGETPASVLDGFTICNGSVVGYAGAVYCVSSSPTISNCVMTGNVASAHAGAIYCTVSSPVISNCVLTANAAGDDGGALRCYYSSPVLFNCLIAGNTASGDGGGVSSYASNLMVANCTVTGNLAGLAGDGIHSSGVPDWNPTVTDCIVWGNGAQAIYVYSGTATVTYSDVQGGTGEAWFGAGCIDADPLFVSGPDHDYYLSQTPAGQGADSPCVDAGSDTASALGLIAFTTRTDGVADTGMVDMGYHTPASTMRGDVDGNMVVDGLDLSAVLSAWECTPGDPLWDAAADLDGNAVINGLDLTEVISYWTAGH